MRCLLLLSFAVSMVAQTIRVAPAELSLPFGTAAGKMVLLDDQLLFIDDEKPESSVVVKRADVEAITPEADRVVHVQTKKAVRDRSGERNRLSFRLGDSAAAAQVAAWFAAKPAAPVAAVPSDGAKAEPGMKSYEVRHNHFPAGGCKGRLLVGNGKVVYESVEDVGHSREWTFADVKELKQSGPYKLKVEAFAQKDYDFDVLGTGMERDDYRALVDQVTQARSKRR